MLTVKGDANGYKVVDETGDIFLYASTYRSAQEWADLINSGTHPDDARFIVFGN